MRTSCKIVLSFQNDGRPVKPAAYHLDETHARITKRCHLERSRRSDYNLATLIMDSTVSAIADSSLRGRNYISF